MKLYTYFRSSAAFRVRAALNLKGLPYEAIPVHLLKDGGEQRLPGYRNVNPAALVPALVDADETITQSMAIIEYLDEVHPHVPLLPSDPVGRARVRALSQHIACDIHPIDNLRVLQYLTGVLGVSEEAKNEWFGHWIRLGFDAIEQLLADDPRTGKFCHGDTPTMADCLLVPQVLNARRMNNVDMSRYPTIVRIDAACMELDAFKESHPSRQGDAE